MSFFSISEDANDPVLGSGGGVGLLVASGEFDYAAVPHLRHSILAQIEAGRRHLLLDLSEVTFLDSTAIGLLVSGAARLRYAGDGSLSVVCSPENERVLRIFEIAGVASAVALYSSRGEAVAALVPAWPLETYRWQEAEHSDPGVDRRDRSLAPLAPSDARRYAAELAAAFDDPTRDGRAAGSGSVVDELA